MTTVHRPTNRSVPVPVAVCATTCGWLPASCRDARADLLQPATARPTGRMPPPSRSPSAARDNGRMSEQQTDEQARSIGKRANELNATIRYTMWSVFRLARPLGDDQRAAAADEVAALFDELAGKDVVGPRHLRRRGPAGRRRPDGLVARRDGRGAAGGLHPAAPHRAGPAPRPGLVADGAAPAGRVQQEPHPGVPGRRGAAPLRLRLPVRPLLRVVPAARRGAPRACSPSTARWRATTRTCGPTRSPRSRSATTSGCSPSRPTSCTASST